MEPHVLTVELTVPAAEDEWNRWYHRSHIPLLMEDVPAIRRATRFVMTSGESEYRYMVLYEFDSLKGLAGFLNSQTIRNKKSEYQRTWGTENRRAGYTRILQMGRAADTLEPISTSVEENFGLITENILTVRLTIPEGREAEWNSWYRDKHMPSVMSQIPAIIRGHRFELVGNGGTRHYLVVYEFESENAVREWQESSAVGERVDEYWNTWKVRNLRRAFQVVFRLDR